MKDSCFFIYWLWTIFEKNHMMAFINTRTVYFLFLALFSILEIFLKGSFLDAIFSMRITLNHLFPWICSCFIKLTFFRLLCGLFWNLLTILLFSLGTILYGLCMKFLFKNVWLFFVVEFFIYYKLRNTTVEESINADRQS